MKFSEWLNEEKLNEDAGAVEIALSIFIILSSLSGSVGIGKWLANDYKAIFTGGPTSFEKLKSFIKHPVQTIKKKIEHIQFIRSLKNNPEIVKLAKEYANSPVGHQRKKIGDEAISFIKKELAKLEDTERKELLKALREIGK